MIKVMTTIFMLLQFNILINKLVIFCDGIDLSLHIFIFSDDKIMLLIYDILVTTNASDYIIFFVTTKLCDYIYEVVVTKITCD